MLRNSYLAMPSSFNYRFAIPLGIHALLAGLALNSLIDSWIIFVQAGIVGYYAARQSAKIIPRSMAIASCYPYCEFAFSRIPENFSSGAVGGAGWIMFIAMVFGIVVRFYEYIWSGDDSFGLRGVFAEVLVFCVFLAVWSNSIVGCGLHLLPASFAIDAAINYVSTAVIIAASYELTSSAENIRTESWKSLGAIAAILLSLLIDPLSHFLFKFGYDDAIEFGGEEFMFLIALAASLAIFGSTQIGLLFVLVSNFRSSTQ